MANQIFKLRNPTTGEEFDLQLVESGSGVYGFSVRALTGGDASDKSSTIATGGTAQNAIAANASRALCSVLNPDTVGGVAQTEDLWVNEVGTATTSSPSICLHPCDSIVFVSRGAISVIAATTGHAYTAREIQS